MSSRPQFNPYPVILNGNMATSLTSAVTIIQKLSMISYTCSWTGAPVGTITVQVSNDYAQNQDGTVSNPGTWNDLTLSGPTPVTGSGNNGMIDIDACAGFAIRMIYNRASGTGTLNVIVNGKVM